jgi:hypothetical protein
MKKIITLLMAVGAFATSFAQTRDDAKDVILGRKQGTPKDPRTYPQNPGEVVIFGGKNGDNTGNYPTGTSGRQAQIDQVNREYDTKIQSVRNNPYLSQAEKDRTIAQLNRDRAARIRQINAGGNNNGVYKNNKKHHDDGDEEGDDNGNGRGNERSKNKGNNGNHYGWEKGKGNPHKNGGRPGNNN